jgi:Integrase zinc binding domain/Chromo (CHRromatin Organisation MOdifier) domain
MPGIHLVNNLWYLGDRLVIPRYGTLREDLFCLAHDSLGHFSADKSYASIRNCYYWPNMRRDLESIYVPACADCQHNKSGTSKVRAPLHPLPIPDTHGDSVCLDFVGPLPEDKGFNCILTVTDRLGSDVRLIPTWMDISAAKLAVIFFNEWYCENGLPLELITDCDKLFVSKFWKALHTLTGNHLKMSAAYHPQTDGASEHTNKTLNQCVRFHVEHNQKGWVRALPMIHFHMMNSVNKSTIFLGFQIHMGRSPQIIPPLVPGTTTDDTSENTSARSIIAQIENNITEAKDALIGTKVMQAFFANRSRGPEDPYLVGDRVMLATLNHCQEFKACNRSRVAKFFPCWDCPFKVMKMFPETSSYTLHLPNSLNAFPTYHASLLKRYNENDAELFPSREIEQPGLVTTEDGLEEYHIEKIVDEQRRGCGYQYLVRWSGYSESDDLWLPQCELEDCKALDQWKSGRAEVMQ